MVFVHVAPSWFFGYDIVFELVFAIVALALGLFALRVAKVTSQRSVDLFGKGFLFISLSYFFQSVFNFFLFYQLGNPFFNLTDASILLTLQTICAYGSVIFMLAGLVTLLYMTFETKNKKLLFILFLLAVVPLLMTDEFFGVFYIISTICFLFVAWHYIENYKHKKQATSLITAIAFLLLLIGHAQYFLASHNPTLYVLGHILELVGYLLILVNFYLVLKK